jgi:hypothetical protein
MLSRMLRLTFQSDVRPLDYACLPTGRLGVTRTNQTH